MVRRISKSEIAGVLEQWRVGSLIKFVTQRVYAEQLIQGIPYLQAIDEFRSKEAGDGRSDATRVSLQVLCLLVQVVQFTA